MNRAFAGRFQSAAHVRRFPALPLEITEDDPVVYSRAHQNTLHDEQGEVIDRAAVRADEAYRYENTALNEQRQNQRKSRVTERESPAELGRLISQMISNG